MYINSVNAIHNALALLNKGADKVNRDKIPEGYLDMQRAVRQAQVNINVIRVSDKMAKSLLDIYG